MLTIEDMPNFQLGCHVYHARARGEYATQTNYQPIGPNRVLMAFRRTTTTPHAISHVGPLC